MNCIYCGRETDQSVPHGGRHIAICERHKNLRKARHPDEFVRPAISFKGGSFQVCPLLNVEEGEK